MTDKTATPKLVNFKCSPKLFHALFRESQEREVSMSHLIREKLRTATPCLQKSPVTEPQT